MKFRNVKNVLSFGGVEIWKLDMHWNLENSEISRFEKIGNIGNLAAGNSRTLTIFQLDALKVWKYEYLKSWKFEYLRIAISAAVFFVFYKYRSFESSLEDISGQGLS